ncbi:phosphotriesterase-related protein [Brevibacillus sp. SYP-B805]|uniref:phosphotriesterase family protein n=1 Tax=Brevibacillus sp. SYP-B805 TaxID=1578199 RepID=UPI0013EDD29D|nr:phosphotriesterase-related protein [Brevibacillus sp. SYP-B805]NGQ97484.1 phosphotriesterase-related protein [Brevibacillus sp. SYP-B805]
MTMVNTVLGPITADRLGKTLIHEHFQFGYPGFAGDCTLGKPDREQALQVGIEVAKRVMAHGVKTVVDPTPNECGRDPVLLKEIAERTGLQIVCATGYYYEGEGATAYFKFRAGLGDAESEIYDMFMKEITEGIGETGIKPGVIKLASSKDCITDYERMFFKAAARAHKETGIPILTHTQEGTMGPEQAALLLAEGVDPAKIVIGHMCGNTDAAYHLRTLQQGVSIAFDRFGIQGLVGAPTDEARTTVLIGLLGMGFEDRLMLSHDTVNVWLGRPLAMPATVERLLSNWHVTHLFDNVIPVLQKAGIREEQLDRMFVENPRRLFS